jgi:hypothetical protein
MERGSAGLIGASLTLLLLHGGESACRVRGAVIADRRGIASLDEVRDDVPCVMRLADSFAERSAKGMLTRAVGAWLLVGLPVIAARIWWSVAAAITVFVVTLTIYVAAAVRYTHGHRRQP